VLRYREPVYTTVRELAMSYFHEYFLDDGRKMLRSYSEPLDLRKFRDRKWPIAEKNLWHIVRALNRAPHMKILTPPMIRTLRKADPVEIKAGRLVQKKLRRKVKT